MFINEKLDTLYRKLDYAQWQKEANKGSEENFQESNRLVAYYKREIQRLSKKKGMFKQLTMF